ncbi:ABC transporter permease [Chengkuizengella axinellae]|uniref:ABC transporter permease n=1 Tax=Chengkuizengella axinellae TaxID=3064388 RepID=A0ABT9IVB7_9BACL|nr:ABC transporter permease [Chengkuizengella sp. 2205SS18-9]MDP5273304.1 ABC transporter permease [Chengkuizengella sp. 2205SS18-9]
MRNILIIAAGELLRFFRMRSILLIMFGLPLLLILILGTALSGVFQDSEEGYQLEVVKVTVLNGDEGVFNEMILEFLNLPELQPYMLVEHVDSRDELFEQYESGEIDYGVVIPVDFSESVLSGGLTGWELIEGDSNEKNIVVRTIFETFLSQVNEMQARVLVLGSEEVERLFNQDLNLQFEFSSYVEIGSLHKNKSSTSAMQYYAASMLVMFLLFSGMSAAISLSEEKESNTLFRLRSLPLHPNTIILGKLIGVGAFSILQAILIILFSTFVYGVDWGDNYLTVFYVIVLTIVSAASIGILLYSFLKSSKSISAVYQAIIFVMTFLSGGMVPSLGEFLNSLGKFTINYWSSNTLLRLMIESDSTFILNNMLVIVSISLVLALLAGFVYWKVGYHE